MPGRSTAGDCRGIRSHAPLARRCRGIRKPGPAPLARADRSWPGSSVVDGWRRAGRCTVVLARRLPSPAADGPFEGDQHRRPGPVPGSPRRRCVRLCQSPGSDLGPPAGCAPVPFRRALLQEVARPMKVLYERIAGPASTSMPPPWPARSPTRTGRRRRWRRWPRRWRRGEKRDRRATWLRWRVPSDGGQWRWRRCCRWNGRRSECSPARNAGSRGTDVVAW